MGRDAERLGKEKSGGDREMGKGGDAQQSAGCRRPRALGADPGLRCQQASEAAACKRAEASGQEALPRASPAPQALLSIYFGGGNLEGPGEPGQDQLGSEG